MAVIPRFQYKIASGLNVGSGSLVNVELIKPTGGTYFYAPDSYGTYSLGQRKMRLNGTLFNSGYKVLVWKFDYITWVQVRYLMTTYCSSAYDGDVTINTTTDATTTYSRLNAHMILPELPASEKNFTIFPHFRIVFTRLATAS
jgi:hypothetical protein